jgi:hypothetical protein
MPLVWTGAQFETEGGSDTEESDSEQPLTEAEQVVALLNTKAKRPPPLPVDRKHAVSTAAAVRNHILAVPYEKRTIAHDQALRTPVTAQKIETWLEQQLGARRTERTIRLAMCFALNPNRSIAWVTKKAKGTSQSASTAKGLALHLRFHPFTRSDVQRGCSLLQQYSEHRQTCERERLLVRHMRQRSSDSLDVAVVLIGFHSTARHFGAHRYRCVM